ncbi:unnamed protein product [Dibothriocephalus latus]|uniref:Intraflagellar transport protein 57 homolog n=1 Tax=Dibothriocephalus latus TaxID=60516 RepID=A0A3P7LCU9_DIBLA|nr:unnamed protein product [Dibothriocephalus latus]
MTELTNEPVKKDPEDPEEADVSPFTPFQMMESLLEKLKSLDYEQQYCRRMRLKGFSKVYFAVPTNPGEQFNSFVSLAAWLIDQSGGSMEQPQEYDDPNATIANVLELLRGLGYSTEFPPSKLKSGCGGPCIRVLDLLASAAVKNKKLRFELPQFSQDEADDPGVEECTHSDDDDDLVEWTSKRSRQRSHNNRAGGFICDSETDAEVIDDDEAVLDLEGQSVYQPNVIYDYPTSFGMSVLTMIAFTRFPGSHQQKTVFTTSAQTTETTDDSLVDPHGLFGSLLTHAQLGGHYGASEMANILEPAIDRGDWQLEVERVLPQLRVAIRTEAKDWRSHLEQMTRHKTEIEACFSESKGYLQRLHEDLSRSLDKIGSREKYINSQVDQLLTEYRCAQVSSLSDFS